jgi:hypothetical protein
LTFVVAAALPVLRWKRPAAGAFRLRAGTAFAVLGVAFSAALLTRMHRGELLALALTAGVAFANWLWARRRGELPQGL